MEVWFLNQPSTSRFFRIYTGSAFLRGLPYVAICPLIMCPVFSVRVLHFRHHRFLGHRQDIGFFSVFWAIIAFYSISQDIGLFRFFAIVAFKGIGRILVFITFRSVGFSKCKILKRIIGFQRFKRSWLILDCLMVLHKHWIQYSGFTWIWITIDI